MNSLIVILTFLLMEFVAWFTHKYIMHGFLWFLHKDHHQKEPGVLERNDSFFLIFALPSFLFFWFGAQNNMDYRFWIGLGILVYGISYFMVHEVFIHQRLKYFTRSNNRYLRAIRKAHKVHHKHLRKEHGECFGMLLVPMRYFEKVSKD